MTTNRISRFNGSTWDPIYDFAASLSTVIAGGTSLPVSSSANTLTITGGTGVTVAGSTAPNTVTLSIGQNVATTASPTFATITATTGFSGPGGSLTALNATQLTSGTVPSLRLSGSYTGITDVGTLTALSVTGAVTAGSFSGSGASLTALNATQLTTGTVPAARLSGAYTGITDIGTIAGLSFTGQILGPAGSLTAPSYSFTGDTNTGIYHSVADRMDMVAGGVYCGAAITQGGVGALYAPTPTTTNAGTWRDGGFGQLAIAASNFRLKDDIHPLDGPLAMDILQQLQPVTFLWKQLPGDTPEVAALRAVNRHAGFIAEWMSDVDSPFDLVDRRPPEIPEGASEEEASALIHNLALWEPSYWKEPHVIALLTAAVKYLSERVSVLEAAINPA